MTRDLSELHDHILKPHVVDLFGSMLDSPLSTCFFRGLDRYFDLPSLDGKSSLYALSEALIVIVDAVVESRLLCQSSTRSTSTFRITSLVTGIGEISRLGGGRRRGLVGCNTRHFLDEIVTDLVIHDSLIDLGLLLGQRRLEQVLFLRRHIGLDVDFQTPQ